MDQMNVQRWASSLRQFQRNSMQPPIVTDVCMGSANGVRNPSTTMKVREYESSDNNHKYSFTSSENKNSMSEDSNRLSKSQFHTFDMSTKDDQTSHSLSTAQHLDNRSSDPHDIDTLSDAGTYIIEDDESEQKFNSSPSSSFKRYVNPAKHRHGTFDIHGLISSTAHTIHRPVVDSNLLEQDLSCSSTDSSLLSFNENEENQLSTQQQCLTPPKQLQIKPAEAFVISPVFATKSFPVTHIPRRKIETQWKSKSTPTDESLSSSTHPDQNPSENYSFHLQKQPLLKSSIRPHTAITDPTLSFEKRQRSSLSTVDKDEPIPNLTKIYANKSFLLRQQRSNITPPSRQPLKSIPSATSTTTNSMTHTNRAVELRRARAQAKIEELSRRTKKQLHKPNQQMDIMSASWHSNASSTNKKDQTSLRTTQRTKTAPQKQDLSATRTISSSLYQRSSSASPNPMEETQDQHRQKMSASAYDIEEERCDSLRDNGQRLAIKLIQLSSGILEKLKPNDVVSVRELEELVDKLQTINRTLTSIDATLTGPSNDDTFV